MNTIIHKRKHPEDGRITFPHLQCWNPETETATIAAQVSGKRVSCRISYSVLKSRFPEITGTPMETVEKYRKEVEEAARKLIENKTYENDGSIKIRSRDLS
ncbi:MAG TPA: DUF1488 domain-containing protein [Gammaproteobacteria bacterium]|nr:DUF1488 domain-containing protein [Gammaproteobacteria bacterium]